MGVVGHLRQVLLKPKKYNYISRVFAIVMKRKKDARMLEFANVSEIEKVSLA